MKRILRLRACFTQIICTFSYLKPRYSSLLAALTTMCLYAHAQSPGESGAAASGNLPDTITPLQIGDTIPEYLWHLPLQVVNHPEGSDTVRLNDYKGNELLILEFWGSMCPPCIESVDKLNEFQHQLGDNLGVLPLLTHSKVNESTVPFMKKRGWTLPSVVNDTMLSVAFSKYLPDWGDVWIYKGRLLAVPKRGYLSEQTIQQVLNGQAVHFINRRNVPDIDFAKPLFTNGNGPGNVLYTGAGKIAQYDPVYGSWSFEFIHADDSTTIIHACLPLEGLLREAYRFDVHPNLTGEQSILWNADSSLTTRLTRQPTKTTAAENIMAREEWRKDYCFAYNLRFDKIVDTAAALRVMQKDLLAFVDQAFGLTASMERAAHHRYAVLRLAKEAGGAKLPRSTSPNSTHGHNDHTFSYQSVPLNTLIRRINRSLALVPGLALTIPRLVDSTGLPSNARYDFEFSKPKLSAGNIDDIQDELGRYGMFVSIEQRAVPVLVVRNSNGQHSNR